MEMTIPISQRKYYKSMLTVVSSLIPGGLTAFEIHILANMFMNNIRILNKITRLDLRLLLDTSEYNFNNYIKKLKSKRVLLETEEGLELNPNISNALEDKTITIEFDINK